MSHAVRLTDDCGRPWRVAAEHVVSVCPVNADHPDGPCYVVTTATSVGPATIVSESADDVASLVWPARWQSCFGDDPDYTAPPDGWAPVADWEPVHAVECDGNFGRHVSTFWRRPLRRIGGAS